MFKLSTHKVENILKSSIQYLEENLFLKKITIFVNFSSEFSSLSALCIGTFLNRFPTVIADTKELKKNLASRNYHSRGIKEILSNAVEMESLHVIFLSYNEERYAISEIKNYFKNMDIIIFNQRPKSLIFLFGKNRISRINHLLRLSWSFKFLDVAIIEIVKKKNELHSKFGTSDSTFSAQIYQYNSFNDTYYKEYFSKNSIIFPDKLKNLNGFPVNGGGFPEPIVKKAFETRDLDDGLFLTSTVIKFVFKAMNFSVKLQFPGSPSISLYHVVKGDMDFSFYLSSPLKIEKSVLFLFITFSN